MRAGHWPASRRLIRSFRIRKERSFFPSFGEEERITFFRSEAANPEMAHAQARGHWAGPGLAHFRNWKWWANFQADEKFLCDE